MSDPIGYVILTLCLAGFLGIGLYFGLSAIIGRKKWVWPAGKRITGKFSDCTAHVVFLNTGKLPTEYDEKEIARRAAVAVACTYDVAKKRGYKGAPKEVVVHVCGDADYDRLYDDKWEEYYKQFGKKIEFNSNGMLQEMGRKAGEQTMPLIACRAKAFGSTPQTGSLVVHELTHFIIGATEDRDPQDPKDNSHSDPKYWAGHQGSFELEVTGMFKEVV